MSRLHRERSRSDSYTDHLVPGRLMVGQRVLAPFIVVRIHARQHGDALLVVFCYQFVKYLEKVVRQNLFIELEENNKA